MTKFIPEPFFSMNDALRCIYFSVFPQLHNDREVLQALYELGRSTLQEQVSVADPTKEELPLPTVRTSSDRSWFFQSEAQKAANEISRLSLYYEHCRVWQSLALDPQTVFDPMIMIKPIVSDAYGLRSVPKNRIALTAIPSGLLDIAKSRRRSVHKEMREALCAGVIRAYQTSVTQGMIEFRTQNVWLDDKIAAAAFKTGKAPEAGWGSGLRKIDLRFNREELAAAFPPYGTESEDQTNGALHEDDTSTKQTGKSGGSATTSDVDAPVPAPRRVTKTELEAAWLNYVAEYEYPARPNRAERRAKYRELGISVSRGDQLHKKLSPDYWKRTNNKEVIEK